MTYQVQRAVNQMWESANLAVVVVYADFQSPQELRVMVGKMELGFAALLRGDPLSMHQIRLSSLVEPDRDFQNQKQVIPRRANAAHHLRDLV